MGNLLRRYWQPALLSEELPSADGPPVRVRLLGEDLVAFRDTNGAVGLVDAFCPHRRAPMFFGRNEECGLRCVYHGWKFDATGACVDMPSEPPDSMFKTKVTIAAYPTWEGGGMVWAYLGPPETNPGPPDYEFLRAPAACRRVTKTVQECNWLQALEGAIDSNHFAFLHCMDIGEQKTLIDHDRAPRMEFEETVYGFAGVTIHKLDAHRAYVRTNHYVVPALSIRSITADSDGNRHRVPIVVIRAFIPIDDERCWRHTWMYSYDPAVPIPDEMWLANEAANARGPADRLEGYRIRWNRSNDYGFDRSVQKTKTFSGIAGIDLQDVAIQEGMGPVLDRSNEHLASGDRGVILMRQHLLEAISAVERGERPRGSDPAAYRSVRAADAVLPHDRDWRPALKDAEVARF